MEIVIRVQVNNGIVQDVRVEQNNSPLPYPNADWLSGLQSLAYLHDIKHIQWGRFKRVKGFDYSMTLGEFRQYWKTKGPALRSEIGHGSWVKITELVGLTELWKS
jgi:hypothetical protein